MLVIKYEMEAVPEGERKFTLQIQNEIFEAVKSWNLSIVFVIGGDGTHRGALKLHELAQERKEPSAV